MKTVGSFRLGIGLFFRVIIGSLVSLLVDLSVMLIFNNPFGRMICQLLCFSASFSLVYLKAWQAGYSDRNQVKYDHIKENKLKGLYAGAIAVIPFLILSVLLVFFKITEADTSYLFVYRFLNPAFMPLNYSLLPPALTLREIGMFPVAAAALTPLIFAVISGFAYYIGYSEVYLSVILGLNKKKAG